MVINASHYMLATGCLSGISLLLHLMSAGNFLPDEEVWLLGTLFWYIHYWLNFVARLCLLSSTVLIGLEVYAPNMITSYTSVNGRTLKMYLTKVLAIAVVCIFVRFILPGPVTSFGRIYKLAFMTNLSAVVINIMEQSQSGGLGTMTRRWGIEKKDSEEDTNLGEDRRRSDSILTAAPTKRQLTAMELLQTETTYVRNLKIIVEVYKIPLEKAVQDGSPILATEDIRSIFGGIEDILKVHMQIHHDLTEVIQDWEEDCCIANIITKYQSHLTKVYPSYVNYFDMGKDSIIKQKKVNTAFSDFMNACFNNPTCLKQPLDALLIRPVQRLPSMSLLVNDLKRRTPEEYQDHTQLEQANEALRQVLSHINEDKRKMEGKMKIFDLIYEVDGCPVEIVSSNRLFVSRINITTMNEGLYRTGERLALYLLTDMIEVSKYKRSPKKNTPLIKHIRMLPLTEIHTVIDINETEECSNMFGLQLAEAVQEDNPQVNGGYQALTNAERLCICQALDDRTYKDTFIRMLGEQMKKVKNVASPEQTVKKMDHTEVQPLLRKGSKVFRKTRPKAKRD